MDTATEVIKSRFDNHAFRYHVVNWELIFRGTILTASEKSRLTRKLNKVNALKYELEVIAMYANIDLTGIERDARDRARASYIARVEARDLNAA